MFSPETPKSDRRPRANSTTTPRARAGSLTSSIGSFIQSLSADDHSEDDPNEFIVAPIFDDVEIEITNENIEHSPKNLNISTNTYDNLDNDELIVYDSPEDTLYVL